jgi:hypothetical protein
MVVKLEYIPEGPMTAKISPGLTCPRIFLSNWTLSALTETWWKESSTDPALATGEATDWTVVGVENVARPGGIGVVDTALVVRRTASVSVTRLLDDVGRGSSTSIAQNVFDVW